MDSILTSVKKMLGITEDYEYFDADIIMHINSVFSVLKQLGAGSDRGFAIKDKTAVWSNFMKDDPRLDFVKTYMYQKVKLMFDPPSSSALMEAANKLISELEWRINIETDGRSNSEDDEPGIATDAEIAEMLNDVFS